ncbi:hypothetical protein HY772_02950 [Candidatus Woesearchaeota archaeon]|nr:hypothetical protein [Candidatus Woesearchaeota archaeon]
MIDYVTPEEIGTLRERALDKFIRFYEPILQKFDSKYHVDFIRFVETGEASPEFIAYIDDDNADNKPLIEATDYIIKLQGEALSKFGRELREREKQSLEKKVKR